MNLKTLGAILYKFDPLAQYSIDVNKDGEAVITEWIGNSQPTDEMLAQMEKEWNETHYADRRMEAYLEEGLTPEKLTIALWESLVEGRVDNVTEIQNKREQIKQRYPIKER